MEVKDTQLLVGNSRWGEMVLHLNRRNMRVTINNSHIRGYFKMSPKPRRCSVPHQILEGDIYDLILSFLKESDAMVAEIGFSMLEISTDPECLELYWPFQGTVIGDLTSFSSKTRCDKFQSAMRKLGNTVKADLETGFCKIDSGAWPEFWLHFHLPQDVLNMLHTYSGGNKRKIASAKDEDYKEPEEESSGEEPDASMSKKQKTQLVDGNDVTMQIE